MGRIIGGRGSGALLVAAFLFFLVLALYGGGLRYPLVFDDAYWFAPANMQALAALGFESRFLSKAYSYYLVRVSHGEFASLHLASIALHALCAIAAFFFLRRLVAAAAPRMPAVAVAAIAALIFAAHPVQVYTVAYPGEQENMLATLFSVAALYAWLEGLLRREARWLVVSVVAYAGAVLSKENLIMVPALALAMSVVVEAPSRALLRRIALPFCLLGIVALGTLALVAQNPAAMPATGFPETQIAFAAAADAARRGAYLDSVANQAALFFRYGLLWLIPNPAWMAIDIQLPPARGLSDGATAAGVIGFLLWPVAATALLLRRGRWGLVGFGLLWPWLLYFTEFAALRTTEAFVLYRLYPWIIGPCLALAIGLAGLARRAMPIVAVILVGVLFLIARERLGTFASTFAVWDDAIRVNRPHETVSPAAYRPYLNRGNAILAAGRNDDALRDFTIAVRLAPDAPESHFDAAVAQERLGRYDQALAAMNAGLAQASRLHPTMLARAYANRAAIFLDLRRGQDALADLERAAGLDPGRADYRRNADLLRAELDRAKPPDR